MMFNNITHYLYIVDFFDDARNQVPESR